MEKIKIALVDDQQLFRQGIALFIEKLGHCEVMMQAEHGADFLEQLSGTAQHPDIAFVDMEMPVMDGMELTKKLQERYPGIKTISLSVIGSERVISRMIQLGASGYLVKNCEATELELAINTVYKTGFYINPSTLQAIQRHQAGRSTIKNVNQIKIDLTGREQDVLRLICKEYTNAEIAGELFLSVRTVEGHRNNLLLKTGCKNTAGLVLFAVRNHLIDYIG